MWKNEEKNENNSFFSEKYDKEKRASCGRHLQPPFQQKCHLKASRQCTIWQYKNKDLVLSFFPKNMKQTRVYICIILDFF